MSDQSNVRTTLRPREADALRVWDSLPANERNYEKVAKTMQPNVTAPRAAVYVRDALRITGREAEMPRGRQGGTGVNRTATVAVSPMQQQIEALVKQNEQTFETLNTSLAEAKANAESFDAEKAIQAHTDLLEGRVKAAQAALDAFDGDAAEAWAADEETKLVALADQIENEVGAKIVEAERNMAMAREMLDRFFEMNPDAVPTEGDGDDDAGSDDDGGDTDDGDTDDEK